MLNPPDRQRAHVAERAVAPVVHVRLGRLEGEAVALPTHVVRAVRSLPRLLLQVLSINAILSIIVDMKLARKTVEFVVSLTTVFVEFGFSNK